MDVKGEKYQAKYMPKRSEWWFVLLLLIPISIYFYKFIQYGDPIKVTELYFKSLYEMDYKKAASLLSYEDRQCKYKYEFLQNIRPESFGNPRPDVDLICEVLELKVNGDKAQVIVRLKDYEKNPNFSTIQSQNLVREWRLWKITNGWNIKKAIDYEHGGRAPIAGHGVE